MPSKVVAWNIVAEPTEAVDGVDPLERPVSKQTLMLLEQPNLYALQRG